MQRLSETTISRLPPSVRRPQFDRRRLEIGLAHIGVGAFHRCHQAEFTDDMLEARFGPWGEIGINLLPPRLDDLLAPQDGLYARTLRQGAGAETRVIGSMRRTLDIVDAAGAQAAVEALAAPSLHVVTTTVTEKGYGLTPATRALDFDNPGVRADLSGDAPPRTLVGLLAQALERRRVDKAPGLTLISCDNVPSNGEWLRAALIAFAAARSAPLAAWIEANVAFPCSMVDRIVPATAPEDIESVSEAIGLRDEATVVGEPFRQWVIEDRFVAARPPWDLAGARFVRDAAPYEIVKMRVLNAAQSTLSHWGALCGHEFSFEAAADPVLAALTRRMLAEETVSTLPEAEGMKFAPYLDLSMSRIGNAAIRHRCHQIGTDGSQKIPQRLLNPLRERRAAGRSYALLTLAVAGWIAYGLSAARRFGARWTTSDPWAATIVDLGERSGDFEALARSALEIHAVFGTDLATPDVAGPVAADLRGLLTGDARAYLRGRLDHG